MSRLTQVPNSSLSRISLTGLSPSAAALSRGVLLSVALDFVARSFYPDAALPQLRFGLLRVRSPLLAQSLLFSFPPGNEMFQFPGLAPASGRWRALQRVGLPHSDIRGYGGYLPLTAAFRSLSRPSSPPRAKASFMRPSLLSFFPFGESRLFSRLYGLNDRTSRIFY